MICPFRDAVTGHQFPQFHDTELATQRWLGQVSAMDHQDPVGQRLDLVKILGYQEHRRAAVAGLDQPRVHIGHGADIQAARRLAGENDVRIAIQRPAEDELLHVAA